MNEKQNIKIKIKNNYFFFMEKQWFLDKKLMKIKIVNQNKTTTTKAVTMNNKENSRIILNFPLTKSFD